MGGNHWSISQRVSSHILQHREEAVPQLYGQRQHMVLGAGDHSGKSIPRETQSPLAHQLPRGNVLAINLWLGAGQENWQVPHGSAMRKQTQAGPSLIVCKSPKHR